MDSTTLRLGQILDETYELVAELGAGGMGVVYRARHVRLPKLVAVKVLRGVVGADPEFYKRFRREAEIASSLGHPNICQALDFNTLPDGSPYLVLEFLEGKSLRARLLEGPLSLAETLSLVSQIGSGLAAAHRSGVVHRDLKPENVFLCSAGEEGVGAVVKILDFGISKIHGGTSALTRDGALMGTPFYMAPEQAKGETVDARADQFALAVMVYELLTGRLPFVGDGPMQVLFQVVHQNPKRPTELVAGLAPSLDEVVLRAMAKQVGQRFADIQSFVRALWQASGLEQPTGSFPRVAGFAGAATELLTGPLQPGSAGTGPVYAAGGPTGYAAGGPTGARAITSMGGTAFAPTQTPISVSPVAPIVVAADAPTLGGDVAYAATVTPIAMAATEAVTGPPRSAGPALAAAAALADATGMAPGRPGLALGTEEAGNGSQPRGGAPGRAWVFVLAIVVALAAGAIGSYWFAAGMGDKAAPQAGLRPQVTGGDSAAPGVGARADGGGKVAKGAGGQHGLPAARQKPLDGGSGHVEAAHREPGRRATSRSPGRAKPRRVQRPPRPHTNVQPRVPSAAGQSPAPLAAQPPPARQRPLAPRHRRALRQAWAELRGGNYRLARVLGDRLVRDLPKGQRMLGHAVAAAAHCGLSELGSFRARMQWVTDGRVRARVEAFCRKVSAD